MHIAVLSQFYKPLMKMKLNIKNKNECKQQTNCLTHSFIQQVLPEGIF